MSSATAPRAPGGQLRRRPRPDKHAAKLPESMKPGFKPRQPRVRMSADSDEEMPQTEAAAAAPPSKSKAKKEPKKVRQSNDAKTSDNSETISSSESDSDSENSEEPKPARKRKAKESSDQSSGSGSEEEAPAASKQGKKRARKKRKTGASTSAFVPALPQTLLAYGAARATRDSAAVIVPDEGYIPVIGDVTADIAQFFKLNPSATQTLPATTVTGIATDVLKELRMCNLAPQLLTLPLLKRALPMELARQSADKYVVECLYLRDLVESPFAELEAQLVSSSTGSSDQDHKLIAIAQASGAGKTKVVFDVGMNSARAQGYIAIQLRVLLGQRDLRTTWRKVEGLIGHVFNAVESRLSADDGTEAHAQHRRSVYTWLTQWSARLLCVFIMCHARVAATIKAALEANQLWSNEAQHLGEAMLRAQRHASFDSLVLTEFAAQAHCAGMDQATLDVTLAQWKSDLGTVFVGGLFFAYDEVTALCDTCCGLFMHRPVKWEKGIAPPSALDLLAWRKKEQNPSALEIEGERGSLYKRCTSLFSILSSAMEKLLQINYPQVMLDTAFRVWEDVIATSSPTRVALGKFAELQPMSFDGMEKFLQDTFWVQLDGETRARLREFVGRPLFFFKDVIPVLVTELQLHYRDRATGVGAAPIQTPLDLATAAHQPLRDIFHQALGQARRLSVTRIYDIVKHKLDPRLDGGANCRPIAGLPYSRIELIHKLWVHTRLDGGRCQFFVPLVHELVSLSLVTLPKNEARLLDTDGNDMHECAIDVQREPILYAALERRLGKPESDPNDDFVFQHLLRRIEGMRNRNETLKGQLGEQAMAWACVRLAADTSNSILSLAGIEEEMLKSPNRPAWLEQLRFFAKASAPSDVDFSTSAASELETVLPATGIAPPIFLFPREMMGPDLLLAGRVHTKEQEEKQRAAEERTVSSIAAAEHVGLSLQAKVIKKLSAGDAFHTTNPGFFHIGKKARKKALKRHYLPDPAVAAFFQAYYKKTKKWVRIVFNCLGFDQSIIDAINAYNGSPAYADTPILLIKSDPAMFGSNLHAAFVQVCKSPKMTKATRKDVIKYAQWADPVDTTNYDSEKRLKQRTKEAAVRAAEAAAEAEKLAQLPRLSTKQKQLKEAAKNTRNLATFFEVKKPDPK